MTNQAFIKPLLGISCLLIGCSSTKSESSASLSDTHIEALQSHPEELDSVLQGMPLSQQDLLLLTLAIRTPNKAPEFCKRVHSASAKEKCTQVVGRPHLQLAEPQTTDSLSSQSASNNAQ